MILWRRLLAFWLDYLFIAGYAMLLFVASYSLQRIIGEFLFSPFQGQLVGFFTLTLPVFLYFFVGENRVQHATPGKRICRIKIMAGNETPPGSGAVFLRNLLKLLPWEVAHTGVHWLMHYSRRHQDPPLWVFVLLVVPQLVVLVYMLSILLSGGRSSLYDRVARTAVAQAL